jgi:hypothetical protein
VLIVKKASLSLSINAIVIVVLAFVMLGLGLTLTRTVFKDIGNTAGSINEQIRQQILDDLRTGNKPLSFPQNRAVVEFGKESTIAFGIKNTGSETSYYCALLESRMKDSDDDAEINFYYDTDPQRLTAQNTVVVPVTIDAGNAVDGQGLYRGKINIYESTADSVADCPETGGGDWTLYAQKSFFIQVQ